MLEIIIISLLSGMAVAICIDVVIYLFKRIKKKAKMTVFNLPTSKNYHDFEAPVKSFLDKEETFFNKEDK